MDRSFAALTRAQYLDATYYDALWQRLFAQGQITPVVPPDEVMWQQDLGRSLRVTFEWLGNLAGKRVLELGCGPGDYTVMMARRGAHVTAVDLAPASLMVTRRRARASGVDHAIELSQAAAETLAFPGESFDWVVGFGLLHHANLVSLAPEIRRVLKPNGRALFREPLGTNPLLQFVREHVPYRDKRRSLNENPLDYGDIDHVGAYFQTTRRREFYLFSAVSRAFGGELSFPSVWALDEFLIRHAPFTRRWCRYVLIEYGL